ncbi:hypothetical protein C8F04DRAFT_1175891 [Mycena alexandri]|uniref:Uncharacterized protein n=1 Tax=Mycena alexandri TaxID=1745969 RepID=A0AAD6TAZ7_9AGAR|nr:hypothetical protein C8F04DRAFT_1175891 [Mycena alexandri]
MFKLLATPLNFFAVRRAVRSAQHVLDMSNASACRFEFWSSGERPGLIRHVFSLTLCKFNFGFVVPPSDDHALDASNDLRYKFKSSREYATAFYGKPRRRRMQGMIHNDYLYPFTRRDETVGIPKKLKVLATFDGYLSAPRA